MSDSASMREKLSDMIYNIKPVDFDWGLDLGRSEEMVTVKFDKKGKLEHINVDAVLFKEKDAQRLVRLLENLLASEIWPVKKEWGDDKE
jgi:DNA-binding protein YbaB